MIVAKGIVNIVFGSFLFSSNRLLPRKVIALLKVFFNLFLWACQDF